MYRTRRGLLFVSALLALALYPRAAQAQYKIKELNTGLAGATFPGSSPDKFVEFGGFVYFFASGDSGPGLYRTDGTAANTSLVQSFDAIADMAVVNGSLLLSASAPGEGLELWGTTNGSTVSLVKDIRPGTISSGASGFYVWNNLLLFAADPQGFGLVLFVSDGTLAGTTSLDAYKAPGEYLPFGAKIYFTAKNLQSDAETRLFSLSPSLVGEFVEDRVVGNLAVLGTSLYMTKRSGISPRREGELWRTDGVPFTAVKVTSLWPGGHAAVAEKTVLGLELFFTGCDPALGRNLYKTDGTTVTLVKDFLTANPTPGAPPLAPANSCDVDYPIPPGTPDRDPPNGPSQLAAVNGKLYFEMDDGENGRELWSSNGTTAGTAMLADINPGLEPSDLLLNAAACGGAYCRAVTASGFYFTAVTTGEGRSLWFCNGTLVTLAAEVDSTDRSGVPVGRLLLATAIPNGDKVFFSGSDDDGNTEPWALPVAPALSASDIQVSESSGTASVLVRLSPPNLLATVTLNWTTVAGSATAGGDYTTSSGTLTFAPTITQQLISVPLLDDPTLEGDETFVVRLSGASNAEIPVPDISVTIADNSTDGPYLEVLGPATDPTEGQPATFRVRLTGTHTDNVYVYYRTIAISATSTIDFVRLGQEGGPVARLTFVPVAVLPPAGFVEQTVSVATTNDTMYEGSETLGLEIYGAFGETVPPGSLTPGAAIATRLATATIFDSEVQPEVSIGIRTVTEDNTFADLAVTLSDPTNHSTRISNSRTVRVYWSTNGDVTPPGLPATPDTDFRDASGFITFRPGETLKTVTVEVYEDGIDEGDELAYVDIDTATAQNASVFSGRGVVTITDDEVGTIAVSSPTVTEGDSGTVDATFTISVNVPYYQAFTVNYITGDLTATAGLDYVAKSGVASFPALTTLQTVTVAVNGDLFDELNETFKLTASGSSGPDTAGQRVGTATIINDDASVSVLNGSVTEGNTGTVNLSFTATLSKVYHSAVTVTYTTSEGGGPSLATSGTDFVATTGTVTIPAGLTSATFTIPVIGDLIDEDAETFLVTLSGSSGPLIFDPEGIGTINDNDTALVSINNISVTEGDAGTPSAVFAVGLSGPYHRAFTVNWTTIAGLTTPATAGVDYVTSAGTITFPALSTVSQTLTVPVIGDTIDEVNETFRVSISNSTGPGPTNPIGIATITDDDVMVIGVEDVSVVEGSSGPTPAVFTLTLSRDHEQAIAVTVATTGGGPTPPAATAGTDFTALPATVLTFAPGVNSQTVSVNVLGDTIAEALNESFGLALSSPTAGATLARTKALGIILDDDSSRTVAVNPLSINVQEPVSGTATAIFTVVLNVAAANTVTVNYATANVTATAGADYTAASGTLSFDPGESSKTVSVTVLPDASAEPRERFTLTLSAPTNATLVTGSTVATATITDPAGPATDGFYTLSPCRLFDSRDAALGGPAPLAANGTTNVVLWDRCNIPSTASAVSINVTVTQPTVPGFLTLYPSGIGRPLVSVINYSASQTRANNAVVSVGATGAMSVFSGQASGTVHVIIDANGYFE